MFLSCSQQLVRGANMLSETSHYASSRSPHHALKPGTGGVTVFFSGPSCFGLLPIESASYCCHRQQRVLMVASLRPSSGKGFGKKNAVENKRPSSESSEATGSSIRRPAQEDLNADSQNGREEDDDDVVPEVVTNRMLKRIGATVGVPLVFGLLLFPIFYYLKAVNKVDVPEWLPLVVSMFTFGTAGFGITYGVVSSSWDPAREGSLLGWKEAQVNWPLIWEKFEGNKGKKK